MNPSIKRIYHPYWRWEEKKYNMWGSVNNNDVFLKRSINFMSNHIAFGEWMNKVVNSWKYSCEHNLSDLSQNRRAWIGWAACAFCFECPEDITRRAWGLLTEEQQRLANLEADKAIESWEKNYVEEDIYAQEEFRF